LKLKGKSTTSSDPYALPTVKTKPKEELQDYIILMCGREKLGKTSLCAEFEDAIFLMCEPGGKGLEIYKRDVENWTQFKGYIASIRRDKRFRTVIIDTADKAFDFCFDAVCQQLRIDHPSDEEWGKGWNAIAREFSRQINLLAQAGKGVIFTSHVKEVTIKRRGNRPETTRIVPTMATGARRILEPLVDIWTFMQYDEHGERELWLRGDDVIAAGHRLQHNFLGYEKIPMGKNAAEAYRNFIDAFHNRLVLTPEGGLQKGGKPSAPAKGKKLKLVKRS